MIDSTPVTRGRVADTTLPKMMISRTSVMGMAIISARSRSRSRVSPTSWNTAAKPPASTVDRAAESVSMRGAISAIAVVDLVVAAVDAPDDQRLVAVVAAQRGCVVLGPVRHDARHAGLGGQLVGDRLAGGGHLGRVDVAVLGRDEEEDVGGAGAELLVEELVGQGRLGCRVLEAAGDEAFGDAAPEHHGDDEGEDGAPARTRRGRVVARWANRRSMGSRPFVGLQPAAVRRVPPSANTLR